MVQFYLFYGLNAKKTLKAGLYIYAGVKTSEKLEEGDDLIECGKFGGGEIKLGKLKEIGLPKYVKRKRS